MGQLFNKFFEWTHSIVPSWVGFLIYMIVVLPCALFFLVSLIVFIATFPSIFYNNRYYYT